MKTIIIGIAGGTGSGKTTLTEKLRDHFGANEVSARMIQSSQLPSSSGGTTASTSAPMQTAGV